MQLYSPGERREASRKKTLRLLIWNNRESILKLEMLDNEISLGKGNRRQTFQRSPESFKEAVSGREGRRSNEALRKNVRRLNRLNGINGIPINRANFMGAELILVAGGGGSRLTGAIAF